MFTYAPPGNQLLLCLASVVKYSCYYYYYHISQSKPRPPDPPPRDMWGFSGALSPYWQLSESPVCGGFARFVPFVLSNVGHQ